MRDVIEKLANATQELTEEDIKSALDTTDPRVEDAYKFALEKTEPMHVKDKKRKSRLYARRTPEFWKVVLKAYDAAVARDENFGKLFE